MPWLGTLKWCMFDCGEVNGSATRTLWEFVDGKVTLRWPFNHYLGVSDMWRLPKNAYFLLQSQWKETPMVHLVGHWTRPDQEDPRSITVYSNCDTVEFLLEPPKPGCTASGRPGSRIGGFQAAGRKVYESGRQGQSNAITGSTSSSSAVHMR
jgi:hypothetical protein